MTRGHFVGVPRAAIKFFGEIREWRNSQIKNQTKKIVLGTERFFGKFICLENKKMNKKLL